MATQIIPLDTSPNQFLDVTLDVDGGKVNLHLGLRYNTMAGYWFMTIFDAATGSLLIDAMPLLTGVYPAGNILGQYAYLKIGSAYLLNVGNSPMDHPDDTNLGTDFILAWSDTPEATIGISSADMIITPDAVTATLLGGYGADSEADDTSGTIEATGIDWLDKSYTLQTGQVNLVRMKVSIESPPMPSSTQWKFKVWRQSSSNIVLVGQSNLVKVTNIDGIQSFILTTPITSVQLGDFPGIWIPPHGADPNWWGIAVKATGGTSRRKIGDNSGTIAESSFYNHTTKLCMGFYQ